MEAAEAPNKPAPASLRPLTLDMSDELGKCIRKDTSLLRQLGWEEFIKRKRPRGDFALLDNVHHPAKRLLKLLKNRGAPVQFSSAP